MLLHVLIFDIYCIMRLSHQNLRVIYYSNNAFVVIFIYCI